MGGVDDTVAGATAMMGSMVTLGAGMAVIGAVGKMGKTRRKKRKKSSKKRR